ncbi:MAG: hypothetical protein AAF938_27155 [Myxococcota bacterium]
MKRGALLWSIAAACGAAPPPQERTPTTQVAVALRLTSAPEQAGVPASRVQVVLIERGQDARTYEAGVYRGICTHERSRDALASVRCWWRGDERLMRLIRTRDGLQLQGAREALNVPLARDTRIRALE